MIYIIGLSVLSAILYRVSGEGGFKGAKLIRRLGCPLTILVSFWILKGFVLFDCGWYLLTYLLSLMVISTYNDWLAPDGKSENWLSWLVTGLLYGLSAIPLVWCGVSWGFIILRTVLLIILITFISEKSNNVWVEELGRGFLFTITMLLI